MGKFYIGDKVRIAKGVFKGKECVVTKIDDKSNIEGNIKYEVSTPEKKWIFRESMLENNESLIFDQFNKKHTYKGFVHIEESTRIVQAESFKIDLDPEEPLNNAYFTVYNHPGYIPLAKKVARLHFKDSGMEYYPDPLGKTIWNLSTNEKKKIKEVLNSPNNYRYYGYTNWQAMCYEWNLENVIDFDEFIVNIDDYLSGKYDKIHANNNIYIPSTQKIPETWIYDLSEKRKGEAKMEIKEVRWLKGRMMKRDEYALQYIKEQTPEICLAAVKCDGYVLQYVKKQTSEICLEAVKESGLALQYVERQTPEICLAAVKQDGEALVYVERQTPEICLAAVKQDGLALQYVEKQTPEICLEAMKEYGEGLEYVKEQTPEICLEAVKQDGEVLEYVKEQTPEICIAAVKQNGYALQYVEEQTLPICMAAVKQEAFALEYVKEQTLEICLEAVKQDGTVLQYIEKQTPEICLEAVKQNGNALQYVENQTLQICIAAVKQDRLALNFVDNKFHDEVLSKLQ